jgi:uncharacterized protein YtpQ (UPF0354 family)
METADDLFRSELDKRGIALSTTAEGLYTVEVDEQTVTVSLENIRRDYERDGDADAIVRFVDRIVGVFYGETPPWQEVQPYVRYSLEPADYETGFDDVLVNTIGDELIQVFVYTSADGSRITWINESTLDEWGVTRDDVIQQAERNMAEILAQATLEVEEVAGGQLGMLYTEETPFKASLILSPAFRDLVAPKLGWPVYVVVPCRDFAYVISNEDRDFLGRLGGVVVKEYRNSGYPITKDVLEVSTDGITAIGTYPDPE